MRASETCGTGARVLREGDNSVLGPAEFLFRVFDPIREQFVTPLGSVPTCKGFIQGDSDFGAATTHARVRLRHALACASAGTMLSTRRMFSKKKVLDESGPSCTGTPEAVAGAGAVSNSPPSNAPPAASTLAEAMAFAPTSDEPPPPHRARIQLPPSDPSKAHAPAAAGDSLRRRPVPKSHARVSIVDMESIAKSTAAVARRMTHFMTAGAFINLEESDDEDGDGDNKEERVLHLITCMPKATKSGGSPGSVAGDVKSSGFGGSKGSRKLSVRRASIKTGEALQYVRA